MTVVASILLAFFFGYALTSLPLLRAGLPLRRVASLAFASDTLSIATMEIVDTLIIVLIPGAMAAGLGDPLFWGSLAVALLIAGGFAFPVNRWLSARQGTRSGAPVPPLALGIPWRAASSASGTMSYNAGLSRRHRRRAGGLRGCRPGWPAHHRGRLWGSSVDGVRRRACAADLHLDPDAGAMSKAADSLAGSP